MISYVIIYTLLLGVVVALVLSFLQLGRSRFHVFVPGSAVLLQRQFLRKPTVLEQGKLNLLTGVLSQHFHVLGLYIAADEQDPDVLFTTWIVQEPVAVRVGEKELDLTPGDALTVPIHVPVTFSNPVAAFHLHWKLHPFERSFRVAQEEKAYICRQWSGRKRIKVLVQTKGQKTHVL